MTTPEIITQIERLEAFLLRVRDALPREGTKYTITSGNDVNKGQISFIKQDKYIQTK